MKTASAPPLTDYGQSPVSAAPVRNDMESAALRTRLQQLVGNSVDQSEWRIKNMAFIVVAWKLVTVCVAFRYYFSMFLTVTNIVNPATICRLETENRLSDDKLASQKKEMTEQDDRYRQEHRKKLEVLNGEHEEQITALKDTQRLVSQSITVTLLVKVCFL